MMASEQYIKGSNCAEFPLSELLKLGNGTKKQPQSERRFLKISTEALYSSSGFLKTPSLPMELFNTVSCGGCRS